MPDTVKADLRNRRHEPRRGGASRWLLIGGLVLLALILVFWLTALPDVAERTDVTPSTSMPAEAVIADPDPDAVTEAAPLPVEDADPNAVVPQDALIPPAPIREEPAQ
jgi:hypothetical protein